MLAVFSIAILRLGKIKASKSNMALGVVSHQVERSWILITEDMLHFKTRHF